MRDRRKIAKMSRLEEIRLTSIEHIHVYKLNRRKYGVRRETANKIQHKKWVNSTLRKIILKCFLFQIT